MKGSLFTYGGCRVRGGREHFGPYAVIDLETTGLSPRSDRVVEVAIARVDASGRVEDEFATLINPQGRDVGPTFIHGISNEQVKRAPTFAEVAPELLERMAGAVVVAHNATFEEGFLATEFRRAGTSVASMPALCTLWLGRQTFSTPNHKLATLARAGGVALVDKHAALGDVRAVAALLPQMTAKLSTPLLYASQPLLWTRSADGAPPALITRAVALRRGTDGWMQSLVTRLPATGVVADDAATEVYLDALAEVLSDGKLTGDEANLLARLAGSAGMGGEQVLSLNRQFLNSLKDAALDDEVLTAAEVRQLRTAAKALSLPDHFGELRPTPAPLSVKSASGVTGEASTMATRANRGVRALDLQRSGMTRAQIGKALGVGLETVKGILRDAKFYENPLSDPSRLALAREAYAARRAGLTRDRFQAEKGLSPGKSTETWRDAAMLETELADSLSGH
jgi:DNA polymerase-3 subunit epsilon